ncbi:hypothetical protein [Chryseobacterium gallinarum]|nr:hypothetical protein [Chryseobacterium gallinarum]MCL8536671.1 hypothetical protein [Chryseobacterium gallinarum]QIY91211.1 hypothetical protein FOB44_11395 [Chryseobacterium gallinarum]
MLKELKKLSFLISSFLALVSCTQKKVLIVRGEPIDSSTSKVYAPDCYIKNFNQEILIREGFLYKNNVLEKYITPQTESILIDNIKKNGNSNETEPYKKLELEKINNNKIKLFNETHDILRKSGDTLFLSQNIIIIESPKNIE